MKNGKFVKNLGKILKKIEIILQINTKNGKFVKDFSKNLKKFNIFRKSFEII